MKNLGWYCFGILLFGIVLLGLALMYVQGLHFDP
jgi:hypothetical protein